MSKKIRTSIYIDERLYKAFQTIQRFDEGTVNVNGWINRIMKRYVDAHREKVNKLKK